MGKQARILGTRKHFTLFGVEEVAVEESGSGRDPELNAARNEHIIYRYEWYARNTMYAYPWICAQIGKEFYLKPFTVSWVITGDNKIMAQAKKDNLGEKALRGKFPWW